MNLEITDEEDEEESYLRVTMPDNTKWDVPYDLIVAGFVNRCKQWQAENPKPPEDGSPTYISWQAVKEWAQFNTIWSDVRRYAKRVKEGAEVNYEQGWANGNYELITKPSHAARAEELRGKIS